MRESTGRSTAVRGDRIAGLGERLSRALRPLGSKWRVWRSPPDQPRWARPALLALAAVAGVTYAWGMNGAALEVFYGAAARSMSISWHNFFFGAFDPAGTVSVDKLPGALWPQALMLRIFGFHIWAIVLPQVIEGVLTVLVLYRAVLRLAGPVAGITAAAVLAASPVTVALNRGNVADSLLILLLVLAADATSAALAETGSHAGGAGHPASASGQLRTLLAAGVWVGLAFQTKMLVAWLVLPALAAAYLLAAPGRPRVRLAHLALAGAVTVVVSLSWIAVVSLVPAHDRPYVDGTQNNSLLSQTFDYNGIARLGGSNVFAGAGHPAQFLVRLSEAGAAPTHRVAPSWHRLLDGVFGRDDGWLVPAALIAAAALLYERRRAGRNGDARQRRVSPGFGRNGDARQRRVSPGFGRRDPRGALVVLWGSWLLTLGAFFSAGGYPNSYYVAALIPAVGALCGAGLDLAWRRRERPAAPIALAAALLCSVGYGIYLLHGGTDVPGWLIPVAACAGVGGALALLVPWRPAGAGVSVGAASQRSTRPPSVAGRTVVLVVACALLLPAVASVLIVTRGLGPFAAPYEPASATVSRAAAQHTRALDAQVVEQLSSAYSTSIPLATDSSILAAPFILATGQEILPIGGFQGGVPSPTLAQLQRYISSGEVRAFIVPVLGDDPRVLWIHTHCTQPEGSGSGSPTALYDCEAG
ncbi:MAG TPA: glycosyltransferase family 39 protein [Solirubrobacteraceae bacterium]|nr:glycosyltransferase family 39 protein [Solirubrobacteraceae bacterium]